MILRIQIFKTKTIHSSLISIKLKIRNRMNLVNSMFLKLNSIEPLSNVGSIFVLCSTFLFDIFNFFVHLKMKRGKTSALFIALNQFILLPYHLVSFWQYIRCNISRQGNITVSNDPLISNRIYLVLLFFMTTIWLWTNANSIFLLIQLFCMRLKTIYICA